MTEVFAPYRPVLTLPAAQVAEDNVEEIVEALRAAGWPADPSHHPDGAVFVTTDDGREVASTGDWVLVGPVGPFVRSAEEFARDYRAAEQGTP